LTNKRTDSQSISIYENDFFNQCIWTGNSLPSSVVNSNASHTTHPITGLSITWAMGFDVGIAMKTVFYMHSIGPDTCHVYQIHIRTHTITVPHGSAWETEYNTTTPTYCDVTMCGVTYFNNWNLVSNWVYVMNFIYRMYATLMRHTNCYNGVWILVAEIEGFRAIQVKWSSDMFYLTIMKRRAVGL